MSAKVDAHVPEVGTILTSLLHNSAHYPKSGSTVKHTTTFVRTHHRRPFYTEGASRTVTVYAKRQNFCELAEDPAATTWFCEFRGPALRGRLLKPGSDSDYWAKNGVSPPPR